MLKKRKTPITADFFNVSIFMRLILLKNKSPRIIAAIENLIAHIYVALTEARLSFTTTNAKPHTAATRMLPRAAKNCIILSSFRFLTTKRPASSDTGLNFGKCDSRRTVSAKRNAFMSWTFLFFAACGTRNFFQFPNIPDVILDCSV